MATFQQFFSTFSKKEQIEGKLFEKFVKWFLVNEPYWKTQISQIWLWDDYPKKFDIVPSGEDLGIDILFLDIEDKLWAVQAKHYVDTPSISQAKVTSFLSLSNHKSIDKLLLISTTQLFR